MIEIKAPNNFSSNNTNLRIFLGGSIEMGKAEKWQERIANDLSDTNVCILNPRRDDWDSTWIQDPTPGTQFHEQVTWELDAQEASDLLIYYFDANTISPITLLELGAFGNTAPCVVCCPKDYHRYGNVKVFCDYYNIEMVESYDDLISIVRKLVTYVAG